MIFLKMKEIITWKEGIRLLEIWHQEIFLPALPKKGLMQVSESDP